MGWRDRWQKWSGNPRLVVCRLWIHCRGGEVSPLLGTLNRVGRQVLAAGGDLEVAAQSLGTIAQALLDDAHLWCSAANEGDVFWQETAAGDYFTELFTDSEQRYLSDTQEKSDPDVPQAVAMTEHVVVMITVAALGEIPELETDLADYDRLREGLKTLINLVHQDRLRGVQIHFSPAKFGDCLTGEQVLINFPELIPL